MPDSSPVQRSTDTPVTRRVGGSRRVIRPGAPGADPTPQRTADAVRAVEDTDAPWGGGAAEGNDAQLKQDVPPHWG